MLDAFIYIPSFVYSLVMTHMGMNLYLVSLGPLAEEGYKRLVTRLATKHVMLVAALVGTAFFAVETLGSGTYMEAIGYRVWTTLPMHILASCLSVKKGVLRGAFFHAVFNGIAILPALPTEIILAGVTCLNLVGLSYLLRK